MKMRNLGAVMVAADLPTESPGDFVMRSNPLLMHILVSRTLEISDEEAKEMAGNIIGASKWEKAIIAMQKGQRALLPPSKAGVYLVVRRLEDAAALGITDVEPAYDVDWSKG